MGVAMAFDRTGKTVRRWQTLRKKVLPDTETKGLSGASLEKAIAGIALADPSLVRVQGAP